MLARLMPTQITKVVRTLQVLDDEVIDKLEEIIDTIVTTIESGDLQNLEETIGDVLEAGLFGVTAAQPNVLLLMFIIMQIIITGSIKLVSNEMMTEEEAEEKTKNICAKIWRTYGEVPLYDFKNMVFFCHLRYIMVKNGLDWRIFQMTGL